MSPATFLFNRQILRVQPVSRLTNCGLRQILSGRQIALSLVWHRGSRRSAVLEKREGTRVVGPGMFFMRSGAWGGIFGKLPFWRGGTATPGQRNGFGRPRKPAGARE